MANVYLHWFDQFFHDNGGPAKWAGASLVRFADDFVVLTKYGGKRLVNWLKTTLEDRMGLEINQAKTRNVNLWKKGESVDFLSYTFQYHRDLKGQGYKYLNVTPSKKALARERDKLREETKAKRCYMPIPEMIERLNRQLTGWSNYFSYGYPRVAKRQINTFVRSRLIRHLRRRSQRPFHPSKGVTFYRHLANLGLVYL